MKHSLLVRPLLSVCRWTAACILLVACAAETPAPQHPTSTVRVAIAPGLLTLTGEPADLKALNAAVVLLHFWGTWCPTCREELESLRLLQSELAGEGLIVVGIAVSDRADRVSTVAKELELDFPMFLDSTGETQQLYSVSGVPATVLRAAEGYPLTVLDPETQLRERIVVGPRRWNSPAVIDDIRSMLR